MPRSLPYAGLVLLTATVLGTLYISGLADRKHQFNQCRNDGFNEPLCRSLVYGEDMPKRDMRGAK